MSGYHGVQDILWSRALQFCDDMVGIHRSAIKIALWQSEVGLFQTEQGLCGNSFIRGALFLCL